MTTCHQIQGPFPKILPPLAQALRELGCSVHEEPWGRHRESETFAEKIRGRTLDLVRLHKVLKWNEFDLLLLHTAHGWANFSRDIPLLKLARHRVFASVVQFHGSCLDRLVSSKVSDQLFQIASRQMLTNCNAVFLLSSEERAAWTRFQNIRYYQVSNVFPGAPSPRGLVSDTQSPVLKILFAGRLIEQKGIMDLIEAFSAIVREFHCELHIAGTGPCEDQIRVRVKELDLLDKVFLKGYLGSEALAKIYEEATVFVLPSWSEGLPVVLLEAMAAGKPIVTTRISGAVDHLKEGVNALLIPARNPTALAEALRRLLSHKALRLRMAQANRQKIEDFRPEPVARIYLRALQEICGINSIKTDATSHLELSQC